MAVNHYENFPVASLLLPRALRGAVRDIYRFARSADDIADEGRADAASRLAQLAAYRAQLQRIDAGQEPEAALAAIFAPLARTIARHRLPITPFADLLSAFEQDVRMSATSARYDDDAALLDYCARSANPVGRLMLHLYGARDPAHLPLSDAICTGLQLTNFWQDVALDWQKGRVYLPRDALARHRVTEDEIARHCRSCVSTARTISASIPSAWTALLAERCAQARALLHCGAPLAGRLPGRIGLELRLVVQGGLRILQRIDACRGDVFRRRPTLGARDWPILLWRACQPIPSP